jgi:hypothetical protein
MAHVAIPSTRIEDAVAGRDGPSEPLAIKSLLHPTEPSRLALAVAAVLLTCAAFTALVIVAGEPVAIAALLTFLLIFLGSIWIAVQIHRAHLLGQSVRVTRRSLPEVQEALDQVREQLDYHRPIDVYVAAKLPQPAVVVSYLGTKMILIEGNLIGDLLTPERRPELTFLLARYVGAFKARHTRFDLVALLISAVHELRFLNLFLNPYYRATSYSGDQIALACCGELRIALAATERLMSGKDVAPTVAPAGVIDQAATVRHRILPRLAQLFAPEPHLTNRYLNLLFYAKAHDPTGWRSVQEELDKPTAGGLAAMSSRSPHTPARQTPTADAGTDVTETEDARIVEAWESDAGVVGSATLALVAGGLFAGARFAEAGSLKLFGTAVLVVDAVLVVGLLVTVVATLVRRTPVWVAVTALLSAALAGWTGLLPALDVALNEFVDGSLSTWLMQGAAVTALVATFGLAGSRGRLAALMEREPTVSSRIWDVGAIAGGVMIVVSSFLPTYRFDGDSFSFWEASLGVYDILYVVIGVAVIALGLAAVVLKGLTLPWLAVAMSCVAFFLVFSPFDFNEDYSLEVGWWLALGGAAVTLACALVGWLRARPIRR